MTASASTPAYEQLTLTYRRLHHLGHLQAIAYWDQAALMPPGGADARADSLQAGNDGSTVLVRGYENGELIERPEKVNSISRAIVR